MIQVMENNLMLISVKVKFILEIISKKIIISNRSKTDIKEQLMTRKYPQMINNKLYKLCEENDKLLKSGDGSYDYLIKMPIYNLSKERIEELKKELNDIETEYNILKEKTLTELWCDDLTVFEKEYYSFTKEYYSYMGFDAKDFEKVKYKKLIIRDKHN